MKKVFKLALILGIATIGEIISAHAVRADISKETTAQVTVIAGDLSLTKVDNINFGSQKITGSDIELSNNEAKIVIDDLRGASSKGWSLTAKLKEGDFSGIGLKLNPEITHNFDVAKATNTENLNTSPQLVSAIADDKISNTELDTSITLNATLSIPAKTKANSYNTTIVWNLAVTPETR